MKTLFFELVQVAIGRRDALSRVPSAKEWRTLYGLSVKQAVAGVCFCGVQRLTNEQREKMPKELLMQWFALAEQIRQRNEVMNRRCVEVQRMLAEEKMKCCILKGQGIAQLYCNRLNVFRQPGDIDVLVWKDNLTLSENKKEVVKYAKKISQGAKSIEHHIEVPLFKDGVVEFHYKSAYLSNPINNKCLQVWLRNNLGTSVDSNLLIVPDFNYNVIFLLVHAYRHYVSEGLGLRHVMDYYMLLNSVESINSKEIEKTFKKLGLIRFASGLMWILQTVFKMPFANFVCKADEKLGQSLLKDIMNGGNFGHYRSNMKSFKNLHVERFMIRIYRSFQLITYFPGEAIWSPLIMIKNYISARKK